jgi:hypothetical protein
MGAVYIRLIDVVRGLPVPRCVALYVLRTLRCVETTIQLGLAALANQAVCRQWAFVTALS